MRKLCLILANLIYIYLARTTDLSSTYVLCTHEVLWKAHCRYPRPKTLGRSACVRTFLTCQVLGIVDFPQHKGVDTRASEDVQSLIVARLWCSNSIVLAKQIVHGSVPNQEILQQIRVAEIGPINFTIHLSKKSRKEQITG